MGKIIVTIQKGKEGYSAYVDDLDVIVAFSTTLPKVKKEFKRLLKTYLEWAKEDYDTTPVGFNNYTLQFKLTKP